jgi:hypothetical protein
MADIQYYSTEGQCGHSYIIPKFGYNDGLELAITVIASTHVTSRGSSVRIITIKLTQENTNRHF